MEMQWKNAAGGSQALTATAIPPRRWHAHQLHRHKSGRATGAQLPSSPDPPDDPFWKVAHRDRDSVAFPHAVLVEERGEAQDPLIRVGVGKPLPLVNDVLFAGKGLQAGPSLRQLTRSLSGV